MNEEMKNYVEPASLGGLGGFLLTMVVTLPHIVGEQWKAFGYIGVNEGQFILGGIAIVFFGLSIFLKSRGARLEPYVMEAKAQATEANKTAAFVAQTTSNLADRVDRTRDQIARTIKKMDKEERIDPSR